MLRYNVDIWLFRNQVRITSGRTGRTVERRADRPFSDGRLLVADADALAALLKLVIVELEGKWRFLIWPVAVLHVMEPGDGGLSATEKQTLIRILDEQGFSKSEIAP
jgi:hypothetical protein